MGEVWIAHHNTLNREVAVKILRPDKVDKEAIVRFEREVKATSDLSHPNTIRVFDYGVTEDGLCYYAMELLHGRDLSTIVKTEGPLEPERVVHLAIQTAKALTEAHNRGIIHRDLKPGNLILTDSGCERDLIKVVDFGLALLTSSEMDSAVTHTGFIVGTPAYIAPELLAGTSADVRSDIYSLGAVMYELLCGLPPFASKDAKKMLRARTQREPVLPSEVSGKKIPSELENIVMRCLKREPDDRYQRAEELVQALGYCDAGAPLMTSLHTVEPDTDDIVTLKRSAPTRKARINPMEEFDDLAEKTIRDSRDFSDSMRERRRGNTEPSDSIDLAEDPHESVATIVDDRRPGNDS